MKVLQHGKSVDIFWERLLTYIPAERDRLASENARLSVALELAREERDDKVDGLESDLSSALDVLWRRGDEEARTWIKLNYPKFHAVAKIAGSM